MMMTLKRLFASVALLGVLGSAPVSFAEEKSLKDKILDKLVYKLDENGNRIQKKDKNGRVIKGKYEVSVEKVVAGTTTSVVVASAVVYGMHKLVKKNKKQAEK